MSRCLYVFVSLAEIFVVRALDWKDTPTLGFKNTPRVLSKDVTSGDEFGYNVYQYRMFLNVDDYDEIYVGGDEVVLKLDVNDYHIIEKYPLKTPEQQQCKEGSCQNVITVIEKFEGGLFVCGTNGEKPQCWELSTNNQSLGKRESFEGMGISPFLHTQNYLSLTVDGDLYSAAPLDSKGGALQFRRKAGRRSNLWMYDRWVSEPTFISASWVERKDDPENEKIYLFFREKNSDLSPEADPWISRIARVCKVDEGGSKRFFQNVWTSFLKARLVCGFPEESLYFNRLQDIYTLQAEDWRDTKFYALFTSSWNSTAVCIYSIETIEDIFERSSFKGYNKDIPHPRPGTCVPNSRNLPLATISVVKDHPEMTGWVHSKDDSAPFYISSNIYTKIVVDRVQAADQRTYNVLFLSTDTGKIHKVLEAGSKPFIISETQISSQSSIQSMNLHSKKKKLVLGFSEKISTVDLHRCQDYDSCENCVLARDPYCSWTKSGCTPTDLGGTQSIMNGETSVCNTSAKVEEQLHRTKRDAASPPPVDSRNVHFVPPGVAFYLSCPIHSYHAVYTWEHGDKNSSCLQMQSNCLHLIPVMTQESYGNYRCISREKDYTKVVKQYQLVQREIQDTNVEKNASPAILGQTLRNLLLALTVILCCVET